MMKKRSRGAAAVGVLVGVVAWMGVLAPTPAGATTKLVADYQFQGARTSSVAGAPALVDVGGTNTFTTDTVDGHSRTVLSYPVNSGLSLTPTTGLISSTTYSIVLLVRLDSITSQASGSQWVRLVDFLNGTSDSGLYCLNGQLQFYPYTAGTATPIKASQYEQIVFTRSGTGLIRGYVNGVRQFSLTDTNKEGVIDSSATLRFFIDDNAVPNEASAGAVARIRIYRGALSPRAVKHLRALP
jgi:hypothetical protein